MNPSLALAFGYLAIMSSFRLELEATDSWAEQAIELAPLDTGLVAFVYISRGMVRFGNEDYVGALTHADQSLGVQRPS